MPTHTAAHTTHITSMDKTTSASMPHACYQNPCLLELGNRYALCAAWLAGDCFAATSPEPLAIRLWRNRVSQSLQRYGLVKRK